MNELRAIAAMKNEPKLGGELRGENFGSVIMDEAPDFEKEMDKALDKTLNVKVDEETHLKVIVSSELISESNGLEICSDEGYEYSAIFLKKMKKRTTVLEAKRKEFLKPLTKLKSEIDAYFKGPQEKLAIASEIVKKGMLSFMEEQEKEKKEAREKAEAEDKAQREVAQKALQEAAREADNKGDDREVEILLNQAEKVSEPIVQKVVHVPAVKKISGISTKKIWKYRIEDPSAVPMEYMIPNETAIGQVVRSTKGTIKIPGVKIYFEKVLATRI